ncbi:MAG TPA: GNAT family N-acetyltransferase [Treponemataceae bacterium]|nr:GNAT family N-acetyltransferase [Treponemataceae bacterium]
MNFELSDEMCNQIIFAMEDQEKGFVFDSVNCLPVEKKTIQNFDSDRYHSLPVWGSAHGFRLMERFVSLLRNPLAREELRSVLFVGRGVFRNFKNVLKRYPEIERLWFSFKEKEMKNEIYKWYNLLREAQGLKKIGDVPEEIDEALPAYFSFCSVKTEKEQKKLEECIVRIEKELSGRFQGEVGNAIVAFWRTMRLMCLSQSDMTLYVESIGKDFAAAITAVPCPPNSTQTVMVTSFFVLPEFRGLGLGKELVKRSIDWLKKAGVRHIIMPSFAIPDSFIPALLRSGFTQNCGNFIADIYS